MRTVNEITARIHEIAGTDIFGFETPDLIGALPFSTARPWLKDTVTADSWTPVHATDEQVIAAMREYMSFAWQKATDHRGLSANRSIAHFRAWLWLLADTELVAFIDSDDHYAPYGAPILKRICEKYQFAMPVDDAAAMNMASGRPCRDGCNEGCGA